MKTIAIIPSRYGSSRFPGKPLALISGKPMIQWVYENVARISFLDDIFVATDDKRIFDSVKLFGGKVLMTSNKHSCGTERLAECVDILNLDGDGLVLNIQGDEPLIKEEMIKDLFSCFEDSAVYMGTLKKLIETQDELENPNVVKVVTDVNDFALYFSRFCLPIERDSLSVKHYKHIGVYGYKVWFLKSYTKMQKSFLEKAESLEQLRVIENGYKIKVKETLFQTIGVDTPEQIAKVETELMKGLNNE